MDQISIGVNRLDSFLGFHLDLFSHCDGEVVDLMRDKASSLFNPSFRAAVKGSGGPSVDNPSGLLGGEAAVRSRLSEATKEDDLLKKTMQKPYKKSGYRGGRSGGHQKSRGDRPSRRGRSRSRSRRRSRSRSRNRSRSPRRDKDFRKNGGKGRKGNKGGNNNKKKDEKKDDSNKEAS